MIETFKKTDFYCLKWERKIKGNFWKSCAVGAGINRLFLGRVRRELSVKAVINCLSKTAAERRGLRVGFGR